MPLFRNLAVRNLPIRNIIAVGVLGLVAGCVPIETYQAERLKADQLAEQLAHSQTEIAEANAQRDASQKQLGMAGNNDASRTAMINNLNSQIADLQKQNDIWSQKYNDSVARIGGIEGNNSQPFLPVPLDNQLKQFASQNPDLVDYDSARGIVKFKSDVTFAIGDATVTPKVKEVITRFAAILNSSGADGYELLVAGHTDSTPVTNTTTIKRGHFDNWFLSAHRAIAVGEELVKDGVSSKRMGMVGYADKRPIASNSSESGKAQNRRVEVLILPTSVHSSPTMAAATEVKPRRSHTAAVAAPMGAIPAAAPMNKDAGVTYTK